MYQSVNCGTKCKRNEGIDGRPICLNLFTKNAHVRKYTTTDNKDVQQSPMTVLFTTSRFASLIKFGECLSTSFQVIQLVSVTGR